VRKRKTWIVAILATLAVALLAFGVASFILKSSPIVFQKAKGLGRGHVLLGYAGAKNPLIGKGDAFPFLLTVEYDPNQIAGIDSDALDKAVDLRPFEIRDYRETEYAVDARTRVYQREYELQFIDGKVDQSCQLPTIVVRYRLNNSNAFAEKAVVPDPIFVAARLPADISNLELRPISDKVADPSRDRLLWVLWALGGLLAIGGAIDITLRTIPRWKEKVKQGKRLEEREVLIQAHRALHRHVAMNVEPRVLLRQVDCILRLVLAKKLRTGWLEEPDLKDVSVEIKPVLADLLENCQRAYSPNGVGPADVDQTVKQLEQVLQFYFGTGEVEAWRN
jgi:hypothetical protein